MESIITKVIFFSIPALLAITLHEAAHAYMARRFGDRTAEMLGRITLNPIKHIDPVGTILVPLGLFALSKFSGTPLFLFGWAKPVPVVPRNFKDPVRNMRWVSAAGPLSNLAMAIGWAVFGKLLSLFGYLNEPMMLMVGLGVSFNIVLMVLNMLPILPLDGGRVLFSFLPWKWAMAYSQTERFGFIILLALLLAGVLWKLIGPIIGFCYYQMGALLGMLDEFSAMIILVYS